MSQVTTPTKCLQKNKLRLCRTPSATSIRNDFRSKFFKRLQMRRSKSVDRLRQIVETYDETHFTSLSEARRILLADKAAAPLLDTEEISDIIREIEAELNQVHLEYQAASYEDQTEQIVNKMLPNICNFCENQISVDATVCNNCLNLLTSDFQY